MTRMSYIPYLSRYIYGDENNTISITITITIIKQAMICLSYQLRGVPVDVWWHQQLNIYCKLRGGNTAKTCFCLEHAHSQVLIGWPAGTGRAEEVPAKHPHPRHTTLPFLLIPHKVISLVVSFRPAMLCSISHDSAQAVPRVQDLQQEWSTLDVLLKERDRCIFAI